MEISKGNQKAIINREIEMWSNSKYQLIVQHKVLKSIDDDRTRIEAIEKELIKCEKALDVLNGMLNELSGG